MILAQVLALSGEMGIGFLLVLVFLLEWFYPVFFEIGLHGATPGKRVIGIVVVEDSGLPVSLGASVTRNILRFADFLPFFYGFGVLSILLTSDFKRLGDLAAGTLVVYQDKQGKIRALPAAEPLPPELALSMDIQLATIALAERSPRLTPERLDELALLAERAAWKRPVLDVRQRVFGLAQWLMGNRPG
jgi:hypothetical protein